MANSGDGTIQDREIQALSCIGTAINRVLLLAEENDSNTHRKEWLRQAWSLHDVATVLQRHHKDEVAVGWSKDAAESQPYPLMYVATRHIEQLNNDNVQLLRRGLQGNIDQQLTKWFQPEDLALRGFRQHFAIVERTLRLLDSTSSKLERIKLRDFFTEYILLVTFEEFETRFEFGAKQTAFLRFLTSDPPNTELKCFKPGRFPKKCKEILKAIGGFEDYNAEFAMQYIFVNHGARLPASSTVLETVLTELKTRQLVSRAAFKLAHTIIGYKLRWVSDSAFYLRFCINYHVKPHWEAVKILPFGQALSSLARSLDDLDIVLKQYWKCIDNSNRADLSHADPPQFEPATSFSRVRTDSNIIFGPLDSATEETIGGSETSSVGDEKRRPRQPPADTLKNIGSGFEIPKSNLTLERLNKELWGTACELWLAHLTRIASSTVSLLNNSRAVRYLRKSPPIKILDFRDRSLPAFRPDTTQPPMMWEEALSRADLFGNLKELIKVLQRLQFSKHDFKEEAHRTCDVTVPVETLLVQHMAKASRNSSAPIETSFKPLIATPSKVSFISALILDALIKQSWPPDTHKSERRNVGAYAGVAVEPTFERTALPPGVGNVVADQVLGDLRKAMRRRLYGAEKQLQDLADAMKDISD